MKNLVLVTGASSGIGKETVKLYAKNGLTVAAASRNTEKLDNLKEECAGFSGEVVTVKMDVQNFEDTEEKLKELSGEYFISTLVNNAGVTSFQKAMKDSPEIVKEIINTNLLGAIFLMRGVLPKMIENGTGNIVNIISVVAKKIFTNSSVYSASKSGLLAYSDVLREELRGKGIRITNVLPGATKTAIWHESAIDKLGERMMEAGDIAKVIYNATENKSSAVIEDIVLRPIGGDL